MKILVIHNKRGTISHLGIPVVTNRSVSLVPPKGLSVTAVDVPELVGEVTDEKTLRRLIDFKEKYYLDVGSKPPKLVQKETTRKGKKT